MVFIQSKSTKFPFCQSQVFQNEKQTRVMEEIILPISAKQRAFFLPKD